jgi:hypothetical protein
MKRTDLKNRLRLIVSLESDDSPRIFDRLVNAPSEDVAQGVAAGVSAFNEAFNQSIERARQQHAEKQETDRAA